MGTQRLITHWSGDGILTQYLAQVSGRTSSEEGPMCVPHVHVQPPNHTGQQA